MKSQLQNEQVRAEITKGMKLLGDTWTLLIVEKLLHGECRFGDLQKDLSIAPSVLTNRLKRLRDARMVLKHPKRVNELSVSYSLTEKGRDLETVLIPLSDFIKKHMS
jgi:DNA-binding HxlR family transcriptional regulator